MSHGLMAGIMDQNEKGQLLFSLRQNGIVQAWEAPLRLLRKVSLNQVTLCPCLPMFSQPNSQECSSLDDRAHDHTTCSIQVGISTLSATPTPESSLSLGWFSDSSPWCRAVFRAQLGLFTQTDHYEGSDRVSWDSQPSHQIISFFSLPFIVGFIFR